MADITVQQLKSLTGQYDVDLIYKVPLAGVGLLSLPASLSMCQNLTVLDVSFNSLRSVESLAPLQHLKTLILVSNKIEALDSFKNLLSVEQIYLQDNLIQYISELKNLSPIKNLRVLSLQCVSEERQNPLCKIDQTLYRDSVLAKLPQLQVLDEVPVSTAATEFYGAVREGFELDPPIVSFDGYSWSRDIQWNDIPSVKIQLDTPQFKANIVECNRLLADADSKLRKYQEELLKNNN